MRREGAHLVTGATGFVGGALVLELLTQSPDDVVCLVRAPSRQLAQLRLQDALCHAAHSYDRLDLLEEIDRRCRAVPGDITEPGCGTEPEAFGRIGQLWHSAASLQYEDRHAAHINLLNVTGTDNTLELARSVRASTFNYVSTAYVAGRATGLRREDLGTDLADANNVYETTKILAERLVACAELPWRIMRPSIVVGHRTTSAVTSFTGLYGFASAVLYFDRTVGRTMGRMLKHRRLPLQADGDAELNLVPIDDVARNAVRIGLSSSSAQVFHLTNAAAPNVRTVLDEVFTAAGLRVPRYVGGREMFTALDQVFDDGIDFYASYLTYAKSFDRTNTDAVCGPEASTAPMPSPAVARYLQWYLRRIQRDGRATAPAKRPQLQPSAGSAVLAS